MTPSPRVHRRQWAAVAAVLAVALTPPAMVLGQGVPQVPDAVLKAAFLFNFAKFTEWPELRPGEPIRVCIVGDRALAAAFDKTAPGQRIGGHAVNLAQPADASRWSTCHLLFVSDTEARGSAEGLLLIRTRPVLTVSDEPGFAREGGVVELYVEDGRMRFAINVDAVQRSGLQLSSRLLGLARIIRDREHAD